MGFHILGVVVILGVLWCLVIILGVIFNWNFFILNLVVILELIEIIVGVNIFIVWILKSGIFSPRISLKVRIVEIIFIFWVLCPRVLSPRVLRRRILIPRSLSLWLEPLDFEPVDSEIVGFETLWG